MSKNVNVNLLYHWGDKAIDDLEKDYIRMIAIKQFISDEKFLSSFVKIYNGFLNSSNFKTQLNSVLVSGAQPNISPKEIDSFNFMVPIDYKEQSKIGSLLNNMDSYIEANNTKLQQLQAMKQSLLQQMFI